MISKTTYRMMNKLTMVLAVESHHSLVLKHNLQISLHALINVSLYPDALDHIQCQQIHRPKHDETDYSKRKNRKIVCADSFRHTSSNKTSVVTYSIQLIVILNKTYLFHIRIVILQFQM